MQIMFVENSFGRVDFGNPSNLVGETLFQDNDPLNDNVNAASGPISEVSALETIITKFLCLRVLMRDLLTDGTFVVPGRTRKCWSSWTWCVCYYSRFYSWIL